MGSDPPFVSRRLHIFGYHDVPVSVVETYAGEFDEIFAADENGAVAGFVKTMGQGQVMMLAATLAANTREDLDIVHQMALKMDCPPIFQLNEPVEGWADARLSRGQNGNFLFINNYQDDPMKTTITSENEAMFGGQAISLAARQGLILPLEWRLHEKVLIHYITAELVAVTEDDDAIILKTKPDEFTAELTLSGYRCDEASIIQRTGEATRIKLHGANGRIVLKAQ